ncbi:MAG: hypothetical protein ACO1NZ_10340 [Adhaeribacter sp.]
MGLFNRTYSPDQLHYSPANEQEAWLAVMHACIAVDEDVAEEELEELSETLVDKPLFEGHNIRELYRSVLVAHARIGSKQLIDVSVDKVAAAHRAGLFAASMELLLADGILAEKEQELIRYLWSALDLEEQVAQNIIHNILSRHTGAPDGPSDHLSPE